MERLVVRLLGEPVLTFDGVPLKWTAPPKCLPLLTVLALRRDDPVLRPLLATTLWPDDLETDARANLRRHLHRIARVLPEMDGVEWIVQNGPTIAWNRSAPAWVDVIAFEEALAAGRLAEAANAYRGDLLEGSYDESILADRERLRSDYLEALAHLTSAARADRDFSAAVDYAERLLAVDEWREDAVREWMSAKYESGDRSAALAMYERFAHRLQEEFSAAPMAETTALRDLMRAERPLPGVPERLLERAVTDSAKRGWRLPFVGRTEPFDRLRALWQRAARGSGGVAFVSGEAGIGKSRLSAELVSLVRTQGGHALIGTTSYPEGEPYQAIVTALRAGLAQAGRAPGDAQWLSALGSILPEVRGLSDAPEAAELPLDRARDRLFDAVVRLFENVARQRPLCVVLEDLHWAGPATIDLLAALARRIGTVPVLIVATYRSEDATAAAPVRALRASLVQERRAIATPLERLTPESVAELVAAGVTDAQTDLSDAVARLSEGNPLFVAQLVENYRETGALPAESSALRSVGDAIAARFEHLDADVRAVAQTAATIGETFRADIVADAGGWDENRVLDALGSLMDRGLVRESSGSLEYLFTHALFRAAFYDESSDDFRVARHRRVATILERSGAGDVSTSAATARHWERAGDAERAAGAFMRAASGARDVFAREEAVTFAYSAYDLTSDDRTRFSAMQIASEIQRNTAHLERRRRDLQRLEDAASRLDDNARFDALFLLERFVGQIFDFEAHERVADQLDVLAARTGDRRHRSYARYARGYLMMQRGAMEPACELFTGALEDALAIDDIGSVVRARSELVAVLVRKSDWETARRELAEQRKMFSERPIRIDHRLSGLSAEATIATILEDVESIERIGTEILRLAKTIADTFIESKAHFMLGHAASLRYDVPAMRASFELAYKGFVELGELAGSRTSLVTQAELEVRIGGTARAIALLDRAAPLHPPGDSDSLCCSATTRALALIMARDPAALDVARKARAIGENVSEPRFLTEAMVWLAGAEFVAGNHEAAIAHAREAMKRADDGELPVTGLGAACWLAAAAAAAGTPAVAAGAAERIREAYESERRGLLFPTLACYALVRLGEASGDPAAAALWAARGRETYADISRRLKEPDDAAAFAALFFNREFIAETASR